MTPADDPLGAQGARRPGWSVFRAALEEAGFRPSKTLGQNFLVDPNATQAIAADAALAPGARVLEIGAGCGFLTLQLAEAGFECLAVEIDGRLLEIARRVLAGRTNVRWLCLDVLAGKHELAPALCSQLPERGDWHMVANLPYSISAPLLVLLTRVPNPPLSFTVLLQEELARRIAAQPGQPEWGGLSARLRLAYRARLGRSVGPQLFWPRPRVASRVLHLERLAPGLTGAPPWEDFDALVDLLFQHRRKQLLSVLASGLRNREAAGVLLRELGLEASARSEVLDVEALCALARSPSWRGRLALAERKGAGHAPA